MAHGRQRQPSDAVEVVEDGGAHATTTHRADTGQHVRIIWVHEEANHKHYHNKAPPRWPSTRWCGAAMLRLALMMSCCLLSGAHTRAHTCTQTQITHGMLGKLDHLRLRHGPVDQDRIWCACNHTTHEKPRCRRKATMASACVCTAQCSVEVAHPTNRCSPFPHADCLTCWRCLCMRVPAVWVLCLGGVGATGPEAKRLQMQLRVCACVYTGLPLLTAMLLAASLLEDRAESKTGTHQPLFTLFHPNNGVCVAAKVVRCST
jgi:hypothetical protein